MYVDFRMVFPGDSDDKEYASNEGDLGLIPGLERPRREWQPTPVFLPGEVHGQRRLQSMGLKTVRHD